MSNINTNFIDGTTGQDIADPLVDKAYLIDRYPELADTFRFAGLWGWGKNDDGELADNTVLSKSSPVQTISGGTNWKQVACGYGHSLAIKTDGTLWVWGWNQFGQLGTSSQVHRSSPVQTISGGTNWKQVTGGFSFTAAIKTDGTLWLWGKNTYGQLGTNNLTFRSSPVQTISGGTNWKSISLGNDHTAAIKTDGTLWLWGRGNDGRLGNNTAFSTSSPVQTISAGTNWKLASGGGYHTAAIKTDGTLWLWGRNTDGQLGDNTTISASSPVQTISAGTNWKLVATGGYYTAAIKTDGTLWLWGRNTGGQLGDNTILSKSSPVQTISGGTNWKSISTSNQSTYGIKTDGTLWGWGRGDAGQLGNNSTASLSSPVQTVSGGTNWKSIIASGYGTSAMAIRDDSGDMI